MAYKHKKVKQKRTNHSNLPDKLVFDGKGTVNEHIFLYAYTKAHCSPQLCCDILLNEFGIVYSQNNVNNRIAKNQKYKELRTQIITNMLTHAETKLFELFESENEKIVLESVKFFLERQGSNIGYGKTQTVNINQEKPNWLAEIEAVDIDAENIEGQ